MEEPINRSGGPVKIRPYMIAYILIFTIYRVAALGLANSQGNAGALFSSKVLWVVILIIFLPSSETCTSFKKIINQVLYNPN